MGNNVTTPAISKDVVEEALDFFGSRTKCKDKNLEGEVELTTSNVKKKRKKKRKVEKDDSEQGNLYLQFGEGSYHPLFLILPYGYHSPFFNKNFLCGLSSHIHTKSCWVCICAVQRRIWSLYFVSPLEKNLGTLLFSSNYTSLLSLFGRKTS